MNCNLPIILNLSYPANPILTGAHYLCGRMNKWCASEHAKSLAASLGRTLFAPPTSPSFTSTSDSSNGMPVTTVDGSGAVRSFSIFHIVSFTWTFGDAKTYLCTAGATMSFQLPSACAPTAELRCPPNLLPQGADGETALVRG